MDDDLHTTFTTAGSVTIICKVLQYSRCTVSLCPYSQKSTACIILLGQNWQWYLAELANNSQQNEVYPLNDRPMQKADCAMEAGKAGNMKSQFIGAAQTAFD